MRQTGMTIIVKNTARLVAGFIAVFGVYIGLTGHISPGGGFAGGVIVAAAGVLIVLAFGRKFAAKILTEARCHSADGLAAMGFAVVALVGYFGGVFFTNIVPPGEAGELASGGLIPLSNLAILVKVSAGLAGVFIALSAFRRRIPQEEV